MRVCETYNFILICAKYLIFKCQLVFVVSTHLTEIFPRGLIFGPRWRALHWFHELEIEDVRGLRGFLLALAGCFWPATNLGLLMILSNSASRCHGRFFDSHLILLLSHCN